MCVKLPSVDKTQTRLYQANLRRFASALASLSPTERNLLYLRFYRERSTQEIADSYGLTRATVNRRLSRIQLKLEKAHRFHWPA